MPCIVWHVDECEGWEEEVESVFGISREDVSERGCKSVKAKNFVQCMVQRIILKEHYVCKMNSLIFYSISILRM